MYVDNTGTGDGTIKFCVRTSFYLDGVIKEEINFLETLVDIDLNFNGEFSTTDIRVNPKERTSMSNTRTYTVEASLCDGYTPPFQQGQVLSVCITLGPEAKNDGLVMLSVDEFFWKRDDGDGTNSVNQKAVFNPSPLNTPYNLVSSVTYTPCEIKVSSILYAYFYSSDGNVIATGSATMGFPTKVPWECCESFACAQGICSSIVLR